MYKNINKNARVDEAFPLASRNIRFGNVEAQRATFVTSDLITAFVNYS